MKKISNKDKIMLAARKRMDNKTFDSLTIRDICKEADVSIGSFYHYFKTKDDLIIEFYSKNADEVESKDYTNDNNVNAWHMLINYVHFQIDEAMNTPIERLKYIYTYNINHVPLPLNRQRKVVRDILETAHEQDMMNNLYTIDEILDHFFILIIGNMIRYLINDGDYDITYQLTTQVNHLIDMIRKQ